MNARPAAILVATGIASIAVTADGIEHRPGLVPAAFLAFVALTVAASVGREPRPWTLAGLVLGAALWSDPSPRGLAVVAVVAVLLARFRPVDRPIAAAAVALSLPAVAALFQTGAPAAAAASVALAAFLLSRRVSGAAVVLLATATLVAWRHVVVASYGIAPDDVVGIAASAAVPLALWRPARADRPAIALALAGFALASLSLIAGKPYHVDAVAIVHRAAELAASGVDPYRAIDAQEALARFGLGRELLTDLEDGRPLRSLNYPALSFLVPAPLVARGLDDLRPLYALEVGLLALLVVRRTEARWRPHALAAVIGSAAIVRQYVLAGVDPLWALLCAVAYATFTRLAISAVALGLACATRQPAWFVVPFYLALAWRREGARRAAGRAAIVGGVFVLPHLPFIASDPAALASGILAPLLEPLEAHGAGLVGFALDGVGPLLPRAVYNGLAVAALVAGVLVVLRGAERLAAVAWCVPLALAWRSLMNYLAFAPVMLLAFEPDRVRSAAVSDAEDADARRQGAARDPRVPGGQEAGP